MARTKGSRNGIRKGQGATMSAEKAKFPRPTGNEINGGTEDRKNAKGEVSTQGVTVLVSEWVGQHNFKVPSNERTKEDPEMAALIGKDRKVEFTYPHIDLDENATDTEKEVALGLAEQIMAARGWSLVSFVNDELESLARSASYQKELAPYLPLVTKRTDEEIRESLIKDFERRGVPRAMAINIVDSTLAAAAEQKKAEADNGSEDSEPEEGKDTE
jgi:hypothetical protein